MPKYIVFENVQACTKFQEPIDLISSLVNIGFQINFGILQAGHYGPPQSRRRFILLAARKEYTLPKLPDPGDFYNNKKGPKPCFLNQVLSSFVSLSVHVFDSSYLNIIMEDKAKTIKEEFKRNPNWIESAPYR